ncbi:MAG: ABC transporter ATP-binding protein [Proteobacteria bacterium]|nr:ABC transporter ATP-binding protein [Pseudomonadota bacterium]
MTAILEVKNLSKSFGGIKAVQDVSFDLMEGELLALIGPNGAGKSTCFNMLMGQLPPNSGSILFDGKELVGLPTRKIWQYGVGRTFQITATYPTMTVIENVQTALLSFHQRSFNFFSRAKTSYLDEAAELLSLVGMADQADRPAAVLAYGDLKRLELAIALSNAPRLLLMDEPTAGMAPSERIELMALAGRIVEERGLSILFTEHDMDVVFAHSHRIMVLNRGELIASGSVEEIRANPRVQEVYLGGGSVFADEGAS